MTRTLAIGVDGSHITTSALSLPSFLSLAALIEGFLWAQGREIIG